MAYVFPFCYSVKVFLILFSLFETKNRYIMYKSRALITSKSPMKSDKERESAVLRVKKSQRKTSGCEADICFSGTYNELCSIF